MTNPVFPSPELNTTRQRLSLDGQWQFTYDPDDVGVAQGWFKPDHRLPERMAVPGCSQAVNRKSSRGHVRAGYTLLPEHSGTAMLRFGCIHASWYKQSFHLPQDWRGSAIHLHLGGVKWAAEFWINGHPLGATLTSRSPVRCDLTPHVGFGADNTLAVQIFRPAWRLSGMFDALPASPPKSSPSFAPSAIT